MEHFLANVTTIVMEESIDLSESLNLLLNGLRIQKRYKKIVRFILLKILPA